METSSKTTPKDFFLWAGGLLALYISISSFITLVFNYINTAFPDPLAYDGDPYSGAMRFSMSLLIVLVPTTLVVFRLIRNSIVREPGKAHIWVRRWALMLTLFLAAATIIVDLITILNTYMGGEISERFIFKALIVLLVAVGVFLHFLADYKGYWIEHVSKANMVGVAVGVLVLISIIAGFLLAGSPKDIRLMRFDEEKVQHLSQLQYSIIEYWQRNEKLPATLGDTVDPLYPNTLPVDPQGNGYAYEVINETTFQLCASFNKPTRDTTGQGEFRDMAYPSYGGGMNDSWVHGEGKTCFTRTIDPNRYPPFEKPLPLR